MDTVFIANNAYPVLIEQLSSLYKVILTPETDALYEGIRNHTDLHVHCLCGRLLISKEIAPYLEKQLEEGQYIYTVISKALGNKYPDTVLLNAITTDRYIIHNSTATSRSLILEANALGLKPIHIKQGYARCLTLPLTNDVLITSDKGVYKTLAAYEDLTVHLIDNGPVTLAGHPNGFFAGTAGVIGGTLYVNGDLNTHPDSDRLRNYCTTLDLAIFDVPGHPLRDIGSILTTKGTTS